MTRLAGCGVLVTRPAEQADKLVDSLRRAGATVCLLPTLRIEPLPAPPPQPCDWLVFISANAVQHAGAWLPAPAGTRIAAVGPATAAALRARGVVPDAVGADGSGAAALLADPAFRIAAGAKVRIVRGAGGREALADAIRSAGASVGYVEVYQRSRPDTDPRPILAAGRTTGLDAVLVSSNSALANLHAMLDTADRAWLAGVQLVGVSPRVVDLALTLGINTPPVVAKDASDAALVAALTDWWGTRPTP